MGRVICTRLILGVMFLAPLPAAAQGTLSPGDTLPELGPILRRLDSTAVSPKSLFGPEGSVFLFWSNQCPWVQKYRARVDSLARRFRPEGIRFTLVNAYDTTEHPEESLSASRERAQAAGYPIPYVRDPTARFAETVGARRTPHAFVFDETRTLVYSGAIDDSPTSTKPDPSHYVRSVLEALVRDRKVPVTHQPAFGCRLETP